MPSFSRGGTELLEFGEITVFRVRHQSREERVPAEQNLCILHEQDFVMQTENLIKKARVIFHLIPSCTNQGDIDIEISYTNILVNL